MANEKELVAVSGGVLMESEIITNALTFAKTGFGGMPVTLPQNYDISRAVKNFCFALPSVVNIEIATKESVYQAVHEYISKGYDIGKHQCALIVRKIKVKDNEGNIIDTGKGQLTVQPEYFGLVARVYRECPNVKHLSDGTVIYEGEKIALYSDGYGNQQIKHEQNFACWNNPIAGAYVIVEYTNGRTKVELMTIADIKVAWLQSPNGDKVHKKFSGEMACKTVLNRLCKKLLNKSTDSTITDYAEEPQSAFEKVDIVDIDSVDGYTELGAIEENNAVTEQQEPTAIPEPKEVVAQHAEAMPEPQGNPEAEDYCIIVKYADYINNYKDCVTGVYNKKDKTIPVYPNKKKQPKGDTQ